MKNTETQSPGSLKRVVRATDPNCTICGTPVTGLMVGTGNGVAHSECYEREHPPRTACTLYQMARGCGDPVLAAEVIAELVPAELAETIVAHFNKRLMKAWLRRCSPNDKLRHGEENQKV